MQGIKCRYATAKHSRNLREAMTGVTCAGCHWLAGGAPHILWLSVNQKNPFVRKAFLLAEVMEIISPGQLPNHVTVERMRGGFAFPETPS